jgi:hypothetical protein
MVVVEARSPLGLWATTSLREKEGDLLKKSTQNTNVR